MIGPFAPLRKLFALRVLLLVASLAVVGCPPADSTSNDRRRRSPVRRSSDVTLPVPATDAVQAAREAAEIETGEQREAFARMADAAWQGNYEVARTTLGELSESADSGSPMERALDTWRRFIDAEEAAAAALVEARRHTDDLNDLQSRIHRIHQLFTDSRLRDISRICNHPDQLPALEEWLDRERPARVLWMQYENARGDMAKALPLARLLRDNPDSDLFPRARDTLVEILERAAQEMRELAANRRFRQASDQARRWQSILEGLDDLRADIDAVAEEVATEAAAAEDDGGESSGMESNEIVQARDRLRDLVQQRLVTIDDYPEMRAYVGLLLDRAKGSPVPMPPMPQVRQYRAVCEKLFAAGRYTDIDRLLATRIAAIERTRGANAEAETMNRMRDDYRDRLMRGVRRADIDPVIDNWLYWDVLQGYFGGRAGKPPRELRLARGQTTVLWPDEQLTDLQFEIEFEVIRATTLTAFIKSDRRGRGGLLVRIQPRSGNRVVNNFAEASRLHVTATVYTGGGQTMVEEKVIDLRNARIKVELRAKGEQADIEVNGTRIVSERLRENPYFPQAQGIVGFGVSGESSRVEIRDIDLRAYQEDDEDAPPDLDPFASREPTESELALEEQIRTALADLVTLLEEAHRKAVAESNTSTAAYFERDLQAFRRANVHTPATDAGNWLASQLLDEGRNLDAQVALSTVPEDARDAEMATRIAAAMKPVAPSAMTEWRKLADDAVSRDKLELDRDRVTFETAGLILPKQPRYHDFEIRGQMRIEKGDALSFLLRQAANSMRPSAFISIRLPVDMRHDGRREEAVLTKAIFNRQSGGAVQIPLYETLKADGRYDFRIVVIRDRVTLWIEDEKAAEMRFMPGLTRPSPIGFHAEADRAGDTDIRLTDVEVIAYRVAVDD